MRRAPLVLSLLAVAGIVLLARPTQAAPQILALLQTPEPLPFLCDGTTCRVELTALCLQRHRDPPDPGARYRAHEPSHLTVSMPGGAARAVADIAGAEIRAKRGYTAVEVRLPASAAGAGAALAVADGASLVPVPVAGDPDPLGEAEIAYVTGALRAAAGRQLATPKAMRDHHAAAVLSRVVNALPDRGRVAQGTREGVWQDVLVPHADRFDADGVGRGETLFRSCLNEVGMGRFFSLRQCLERRQDGLMLNVNTGVWEATQPGS